ncbi:MAG TPA: STAS domain-containing protein [Frankiaceae bacterium]|nr:STAS domain-containing protein [Frankiaceae bacterium]
MPGQVDQAFSAEVTGPPAAPVIRLVGELDVAGARVLLAAVDATLTDGARSLRVDCARLEFVDPAGLSALLCAARRGPRLVLDSPPPLLLKLRELLDLTEELPVR